MPESSTRFQAVVPVDRHIPAHTGHQLPWAGLLSAGCLHSGRQVGWGYLCVVTIDPMVAEACCVQQMAVGNQGCAFWIRMLDQGPFSPGEAVCVASEGLDWGLCSVKAGVGPVVFWEGH